MNEPDYQQYKDVLIDVAKPTAYIDMDILDENINNILQRADDTSIRVASKSVRSLRVLKYILNSSDQINGVMSYHGSEAVYLANQGLDDILVAYPIVDTNEILDVLESISQGNAITLMVDSIDHLQLIESASQQVDYDDVVEVCLDIDMSVKFPFLHFGVFRSPLTREEEINPLLEFIQDSDYIKLSGIMGYEAQIAGLPDRSPANNFLLNKIIQFLKSRSINKISKRRKDIVEYIRSFGLEINLVNGGGTGSIETTIEEDVITEVTVGSGFYSPSLFDFYNKFSHLPAAGYVLEVTRHPASNIYTCRGGGYIASGSIGIDKQPTPHLPKNCSLIETEGAGEVQTPVKYTGQLDIGLGDPIFFRHAKAGEMCEHFNKLHLIRGDHIEGVATTYRGDGKIFL